MDDRYASLLHAYRTQIGGPNIGEPRRNEQAREALRIGKMRFMQMKASTFLVREKGFYPKSLCVQATRLLGCVHIRDHIEGRFTSLCPTTDEHNGTIRFARKPHLRSRDEGAW